MRRLFSFGCINHTSEREKKKKNMNKNNNGVKCRDTRANEIEVILYYICFHQNRLYYSFYYIISFGHRYLIENLMQKCEFC